LVLALEVGGPLTSENSIYSGCATPNQVNRPRRQRPCGRRAAERG